MHVSTASDLFSPEQIVAVLLSQGIGAVVKRDEGRLLIGRQRMLDLQIPSDGSFDRRTVMRIAEFTGTPDWLFYIH